MRWSHARCAGRKTYSRIDYRAQEQVHSDSQDISSEISSTGETARDAGITSSGALTERPRAAFEAQCPIQGSTSIPANREENVRDHWQPAGISVSVDSLKRLVREILSEEMRAYHQPPPYVSES